MNIDGEQSLQETARRLHAGSATVEETLEWMKKNGSSVSLSYGGDELPTGYWECAWITDRGFVGVEREMRHAILDSLNWAFAYYTEAGKR